ncbi:MAG: L-lactate dehydrogenase [Stygiobacter sp. RIFOXYC12_FULL_38_8]|nr:MAG: L-lactate dehydrogenase [Stygiobacter sp. GWC2_38_9]OGU83198.1 MAG: L-lactate dehydrogenase [Stygiobacter sp. RIFOXYA12_FULL_38_9]OGV07661.1 MAG: L-lactate dehydrogenase [Stygiobacter sp. RIFOXYB2_FULL_37_11]OGV10823.1 MAG: L-lactate dehydrogenase [Stygiobacter sp. RIFOXYA2_FULL_38_8]OGV12664.1 MAG: L-lactate dehydrogenase [Stygiobacter sp. RIFOXYC2_FULL_38_25]OGV26922.1 MAG: L-lactate dehydrogenase [Stygiobacter sp. RIFOXYC12_FULL_38_8]OGV82079.1 MAG: L-lactate dehydrogenase [Stygiob
MKVGIIGSGMVGATSAYAIMLRKAASEIVLIDSNEKRAQAEAADIIHAAPFTQATVVYAGNYSDLKGAKIVVIAAGAHQSPGETRLMLMEKNASILNDIISKVAEVAPNAIFLIATNPVDIITYISISIAKNYGIPATRIIGSGTTLDTARFRSLLGSHIGVDPQNVHAYVIGEHGDSEVLTWSNIDIGGVPLEDLIEYRKIAFSEKIKEEIDKGVRNAAYKIIEGKGSTYYGIGGAIAKLVDVINRDNRSVLTISTYEEDVEGIKNVALSLPHLIGGEGDLGVLPIRLNMKEKLLLKKSAEVIRSKIDEYEVK